MAESDTPSDGDRDRGGHEGEHEGEGEDDWLHRMYQFAEAQFEKGCPLGAREGWQPSKPWEKKRRYFRNRIIPFAEVAALLCCRLHVGVAQTGEDEALLHVTFENLLGEEIAATVDGERFWEDGHGHVRVYDEGGALLGRYEAGTPWRGTGISGYRVWRRPPLVVIRGRGFHTITVPGWRLNDGSGRWRVVELLEPGRTYTFEADHYGLTSNRFAWTVPTVPAAPDAARQGL